MTAAGGVTVVIPTVPLRWRLLPCALESVGRQEQYPDAVIIEYDLAHEGPSVVRNRALEKVTTIWVAFLDDDDEWRPAHLRLALTALAERDADVSYSNYVVGSETIGAGAFSLERLRTGNFLAASAIVARTESMRKVGGFPVGDDVPTMGPNQNPCEDWGLALRLADAGCRFTWVDEITMSYNLHGMNYAGRVWRALPV